MVVLSSNLPFNFSKCLISIRTWEMNNLPQSQSGIAYDLFIFVAHQHHKQEPVNLKQLSHSLSKYSQRGIRYVVEQFVNIGYIELVINEQDRRASHVRPTPKLIAAFDDYLQVFRQTYSELAPELLLSMNNSTEPVSPELIIDKYSDEDQRNF